MNFLAHIVCTDQNGIIGDSTSNSIPWHHSEDLKFFKTMTERSSVIMGSKTWESLPKKPLPNRVNIIVSNQKNLVKTTETLRVFGNVDIAIRFGKSKTHILIDETDESIPLTGNVFIIGGSMLYNTTIDMVDIVYMTVLYNTYQGDVFYPCTEELERDFELVSVDRFDDNSGEKRFYVRKDRRFTTY